MTKWKLHRLEDLPREDMIEGIQRRFLSGERTTIGQVWFKKGAVVPEHSHESEQMSFIVEGALRFKLAGEDVIVRTGEILAIPSMLPHSAEALEDTYDLDLFAPRREDWISGNDAYLRGKR